MITCNDETVEKTRTRLASSLFVLDMFKDIVDSYVVEYFTENNWGKLPSTWQIFLDDLEPAHLSDMLANVPNRSLKVPPLTFLTLKSCVYDLGVTRNSIDLEEFSKLLSFNVKPDQGKPTDLLPDPFNIRHDLSIVSGQCKKLHHVFRRHVKPKKQYEITRLTQVVKIVTDCLDCDSIVDIGSGQGHLSRILALGAKLRVTSMEAESSHVFGAQKVDLQAKKNIEKLMKEVTCEEAIVDKDLEQYLPVYINEFIPANISNKDFLRLLLQSRVTGIDSKESGSFGIVGLHTCGNLASTLLKVFSSVPEAKCLFSVACCYMKLDASNELGNSYPMSSYVAQLPNHFLSYNAREGACHAIEKHAEKLKGDVTSLKIHCYRATLESLIVKHYPQKKHLGLRGVKHAEKMTFADYAKKALASTDLRIPEEEFYSHYVHQCLHKWKQVLVFFSIRLLFALLTESCVLLDRLLYLHEQGINSYLIPLFDPVISPRNHAIVAVKPSMAS